MATKSKIVLTGIKPSGAPHIGNYAGAIRAAVAASAEEGTKSFFFLADLHSLVNTRDPERVHDSTLQIAAAWLAAGLDPENVHFYRQSDVPEISELMWVLSCISSKGLLNRAHAYKAATERNRESLRDEDSSVSTGLFMYPVLMAADILLFDADEVPVGRDQVQHIEIARDIAQRFNHLYGTGMFTLPRASVCADVSVLPGLDGRKMSKSYDNTIPLFASDDELWKLISGIQTDGRRPGDRDQIEVESGAVFQIHRGFCTADESKEFMLSLAGGMGWADAKRCLYETLRRKLGPMRERYQTLIAQPNDIEAVLKRGAQRVREGYAAPKMARVREVVGLRSLSGRSLQMTPSSHESSRSANGTPSSDIHARAPRPAQIKQFRASDGRFYVKLVQRNKDLLMLGGFQSHRDVAAAVERLMVSGEWDADMSLVTEGTTPDTIRLALNGLR